MPLYPGNAQELVLFRRYEDERIRLYGQAGQYYVLNRARNIDPVYNEPTANGEVWHYTGPFNLVFSVQYVEFANREPGVRDEGLTIEYDAEAAVSYLQWVAQFPTFAPKEGDVVYVMGEYFDVVKQGRSGNLVDTVDVVGFQLMLKRRAQFTPERRSPVI
jgi:hypothetical protein